MNTMRLLIPLAALGAALAQPAAGQPSLGQVQSVYLLPMSSGLDQYLANRLAAAGLFQVVTEPRQADAVFTDQIGAGFEKRLEQLYPPPKPDKTASDPEAASQATGDAVAVRVSSFGRGRGNLFLVDRNSRRVVWSIYERPRTAMPDELDRSAQRVVARIKRDRSGK